MFICLLCFTILAGATTAWGQEIYFGKNKVQYDRFDWSFIESDHFDIYFYEGGYELALFSAAVLESAYVEISQQLNHRLSKRVPLILYQSHNDFQQTNVTGGLVEESMGGFTESFKNRMVLPFTGSYEDFRHVLHHELTHAVTFDLLYGNVFGSLLSRRYMYRQPLWLAEGFAEYSSRHGWDSFSDMFMRDAVIHDYLVPLEWVGGFLAYKEGQSAVLYLVEKYGEEKISEILHKSMSELSTDNGMENAIGNNSTKFFEDWQRRLRKTYWPEISIREEPRDFAKYLTDHTKDGSFYNERPAFAPTGNRLAFFTDRSDYTEIRIISGVDGKLIQKVLKGAKSAEFESLHSYNSGMAWSPLGDQLAFVSKSHGKDALVIYSVEEKKTVKRWRFDFTTMRSPAWSPDGGTIVFSGWQHGKSDLYSLELGTGDLTRLTNDRYEEQEPSFSLDGRYLVFACDRPAVAGELMLPDTASVFAYGTYNIFLAERMSGLVVPMTDTTGINQSPVFSPDSRRVCFVSDRNGIYNLYVHELDSNVTYPITNSISGCFAPTWSHDGEHIAFSGFYRGGFDIFIMRDLQPKAKPGETLPLTELARTWHGLDSQSVFAFGRPEQVVETKMEEIEETEFTGYAYSAPTIHKTAFVDSTDSSNAADAAQREADSLAAVSDTVWAGVFGNNDEQPLVWNPTTSRHEPDLRPSTLDAPRDTINGVVQYQSKKYKLKFTPDIATGSTSFDPFFGLQGQMVFVLSDYLGDHQFLLYTDLINTIDQSNFQLLYTYNATRIDYGVGLFHSKYHYEYYSDFDGGWRRFSDRTYGAQWRLARPFSKFTRAEFDGWMVFIDRQYYDPDRYGVYNRSSDRVFVGSFSLIHDTVIWGLTGPVNGRRYRVAVEYAPATLSKGIAYQALTADYRQYWHVKGSYSVGARIAGGISGGENPKRFFLGGVNNWIGSTIASNEVYEVDGLYFSQLVTPMRGYNYYEFSGTRYALMNLEFRYPFIDYLKLNFPLPLTLAQLQGALFYDMGAVWDKDEPFKGATSSGGGIMLEDIKAAFGFGIRANLGFLVLRFDTAWPTDLDKVSERPKYYWSLGGDF
jgi:Tol biopolymer transport system component